MLYPAQVFVEPEMKQLLKMAFLGPATLRQKLSWNLNLVEICARVRGNLCKKSTLVRSVNWNLIHGVVYPWNKLIYIILLVPNLTKLSCYILDEDEMNRPWIRYAQRCPLVEVVVEGRHWWRRWLVNTKGGDFKWFKLNWYRILYFVKITWEKWLVLKWISGYPIIISGPWKQKHFLSHSSMRIIHRIWYNDNNQIISINKLSFTSKS